MLSLALIERRIKELVKSDHTDENVREFAEMCLARDYLLAEIEEQERGEMAAQRPRVILTNYCADLNTIPTMEQISAAISAAAANASPEGRQQLRDLKTWAGIIGSKK